VKRYRKTKRVRCPVCDVELKARGVHNHMTAVHPQYKNGTVTVVKKRSEKVVKDSDISLQQKNHIDQECIYCFREIGCRRFINLAGDEICTCMVCRKAWYPDEKKFTPEEVEKFRLHIKP